MAKLIIVNSGSASAKYALFDNLEQVAFYHYEKNKNEFNLNEVIGDRVSRTMSITKDIYNKSFDNFIEDLKVHKLINSFSEIQSVIFRVVSPGKYFQEDRLVDANFIKKVGELRKKSPIHLDHLQNEITEVKKKLPNIKMVAISDSAFYKDKPECNSVYALPKNLAEKYEIYKYGYHGLSVESVLDKVARKIKLPEKIIICHLGGGSSVTAVLNGEPIDNSMGYSPVSGVPMATRVGDIDAEALITIYESEKLSLDKLHNLIYKESGLLGTSGISDDVRSIIDAYETDDDARVAMDSYINAVKKYIGSSYALLNGLDLIVFTGTIGIRSVEVRKRICANMSALGIKIDANLNIKNVEGEFLNEPGSDVLILSVETNEMVMMAKRAVMFFDEVGV